MLLKIAFFAMLRTTFSIVRLMEYWILAPRLKQMHALRFRRAYDFQTRAVSCDIRISSLSFSSVHTVKRSS